MNVNPYMKGDYGNKPPNGAPKNKANSKPNKANFRVSQQIKGGQSGDCVYLDRKMAQNWAL